MKNTSLFSNVTADSWQISYHTRNPKSEQLFHLIEKYHFRKKRSTSSSWSTSGLSDLGYICLSEQGYIWRKNIFISKDPNT